MKNYEKAIQDAEKALEKTVSREAWSEANQRAGYRDGIKAYAACVELGIDTGKRWEESERDQRFAIEHGNYGLAAYYSSWFSGWMMAETAKRLDELEEMTK